MSEAMRPAVPHYLPSFITAPGETDVLFTGSAIFLVLAVMGIGSLYFWLHSLPERMSQLVAVQSLLRCLPQDSHLGAIAMPRRPPEG